MPFSELFNDSKISANLDLNHAKIDNYQIYSIATFTAKESIKYTTYTTNTGGFIPPVPPPAGIFAGHGGQYLEIVDMLGFIPYVPIYSPEPFIISEIDPNNPSIIKKHTFTKHYGFVLPDIDARQPALNNNNLGDWESPKCITFQSFSPVKKIEFDMVALLKSYPLKQSRYKIFHRANLSGIERFIINYETQNEPWAIHLATGYNLDNRLKLNKLAGIAASDRVIEYSYYAHNPLETHPKIYASLDWYHKKINVKKGQSYEIKIDNIMLGTLELDAQTKAEVSSTPDTPGKYTKQYLFSENLPALFAYWRSLMPPANDNLNDVGNIQFGRYLQTGDIYIDREFNFIDNDVRISAANNDLWDKGTVTSDYRKLLSDHPIYEVSEYSIFEEPQIDGSYGSLTMDSPRILEIHAALDAGKYAYNELDAAAPRVTNLGYWIEKIGNLLGHRPDANGEINYETEKSKFARKRLTNPTWNKSQYSQNQFGKRGMVVPHLPNTYDRDGKLKPEYDVVYDIPQLVQALHDQQDISLGIQHGSQIRVKMGNGSVRSLPDILAMQIETFKMVDTMRENIQGIQISTLVTGAEVRGLFGAIGVPVSQKYLTLKDVIAKKVLQVPYFDHQEGKESIMGGISTLKIGQAVGLGIALPKSQPAKSKINPFNVLKKKA
jgi:hypothetical protein